MFLCVGHAFAFGLENGSPKRTNTDRLAPLPGTLDLAVTNAGINRADCLDDKQRYQFSFSDEPDAETIEVWARADGGSCAPPAERTSHCFRVAQWKKGDAREVDNLSIVQAMELQKSVATKADASQLCAKTASMKPTAVHLHVMAFNGTDVVGYSTGADSKPAEIDYTTFYDIGGPNPPVGYSLTTGEGLLSVSLPAVSDPGDFASYKVYCIRATPAADAGTETGSDAGSEAGSDAGGDAGADAASDAATDGATDAASASTSTKCPANVPFVPGTFPSADFDKQYLCKESTSVSGDIVMDDRLNDLPYAVAIAAVDKQGNVGILSPIECETPRATTSFWDAYEAAGGRAGGGYCSFGHAPASSAAVALVVVAIAWIARKKKLAALLVGLPLIFIATPSRADEPSWVMLEARFTPYRPNIDSAFATKPYADTFGSTPRLLAGAEADVLPLHIPKFGSLGFGALAEYTRATAHQKFVVGGNPSASTTAFDVWLFGLVTTLRIDVLAQETQIPLVPYAKVGVTTSLWSSSDEGKISTFKDGRDARGHTNGLFYAAGVMLLLDAFDRQAAKTFEVERGVKHSYVFGELTAMDSRGIGQSDVMRVGALTWTAGLAFEM